MIFEQIVWRDLGCASYLVGCQECAKAIVVDPPLDVDLVLSACERVGARLIGIIETHTHADHVSGHGLLAAQTDAWIAVHESAGVAYEHRALRDGDELDVGAIRLTVVHTPGHRPEHCSLLVADRSRSDEPWMALTGDSLFVGDVARPDLAVAGAEGAAVLHASLRDRLLTLEDGVEIFPGHVAGSLCGKGMSSRTSTTLGFERRNNAMLAPMAVDEFVRLANDNLGARPPNVERIVALNRGPLLRDLAEPRVVHELQGGEQVLDVRPAEAFADRHLAGSLNAPLAGTGFGTRAGSVLDAGREVVVAAADPAQAADAMRRLRAVGCTEIALLDPAVLLTGEERFDTLSMGDLVASADGLQLVDVRDPGEQPALPGALRVPYRDLDLADLTSLDPARPVAVVCQTGSRTCARCSARA